MNSPEAPSEASRNLYAPWRIEYILAPKDGGCFLCRMSAAEGAEDRRNLLLHRGKTCTVTLNRYPYNAGHLLIAPLRHIAEPEMLTPEEDAEISALCKESVAILRRRMRPDGFNLGVNLGICAGAGLRDHIHWHVVPRWNGDTNFMPVLAGTHVVPDALESLWDQLHPEFNP